MSKQSMTTVGIVLFALMFGTALIAGEALAQEPRRLAVITSAVFKKSFDWYIVPKMKELYNVEVVSSPFLSAEALAKALAQRSNPQTSVFTLDEGPWLQGKEAGLWEVMDPEKIANLREIPAQLKDPGHKGSAMDFSLLGLIYDEVAYKANNIPAPASLHDMWNSALQNRISIQQFSSSYAFALLAETTRVERGDVNNSFDAGFAKLRQLRPNVRTFSGPAAQLIQLFQQKEIWLAWGSTFTAMQAAAAGAPVRWVAPKEGAMIHAHYVAIAKGAPALEDAQRLVNLMLSPEYQKIMAQTDFLEAVNSHTKLDPEFADKSPISDKVMESAVSIPWNLYNRYRIPLNERWQREIEQ